MSVHGDRVSFQSILKSLQDLPACCDQTLKSRAVTKQNKHKLSVLSSAQHPASCLLPAPAAGTVPGLGTAPAPEAHHSGTLMGSERAGVSQFVLVAASGWFWLGAASEGCGCLLSPSRSKYKHSGEQEGQPQVRGGQGCVPLTWSHLCVPNLFLCSSVPRMKQTQKNTLQAKPTLPKCGALRQAPLIPWGLSTEGGGQSWGCR